jgi:hypothetical protein
MTDQHLIPLEELNLSVRAYNCLKAVHVDSVSDLMGLSYEDLLEIKNFGPASADDVIEALARIGMTLHRTTPYLELFSPTARAVLFAYYCGGSKRLAAALRAAADQSKAMEIPFSVVTDWEKVKGPCASFYAAAEWGYYQALRDQRAIADELDELS